ncbi:MAG: Omp28-related outer membrane protein [Alistipes sp.]
MKKSLLIVATTLLFFVSAAFISCSGNSNSEEESGSLTLQAKRTSITANGIDAAKLVATKGAEDVTKRVEFWQIGTDGAADVKLTTNMFSTKVAGAYTIEARYTAEGVKEVSNRVTITAKEETKETFFRRVLLMQFTSIFCQSCPATDKNIDGIEHGEEYADRIVRTTLHSNGMGADPMQIPVVEQYRLDFGVEGFPALVLDLVPTSKMGSPSVDKIKSGLQHQMDGYPAICGVAIESTFDAATRKVNFTAKVKSSEAGDFRVVAFLVEDKIIGTQTGQIGYEHNNTVREILSNSRFGDKLGTLAANAEQTKQFSTTLKAGWVAENMRVVVCALNNVNDEFIGNNAATCPVQGLIAYKYNK